MIETFWLNFYKYYLSLRGAGLQGRHRLTEQTCQGLLSLEQLNMTLDVNKRDCYCDIFDQK